MSSKCAERALNFKRKKTSIDQKHLRAHRRSLDWKEHRDDVFNRRRNCDDMSPVIESDNEFEDRQLRSSENFNQTPTRRGRLTPKKPKTPLHERRRDKLEKWVVERNLKKKLDAEKKKPLFKVCSVKHTGKPDAFTSKWKTEQHLLRKFESEKKKPFFNVCDVKQTVKSKVVAKNNKQPVATVTSAGKKPGKPKTSQPRTNRREEEAAAATTRRSTRISSKTATQTPPQPLETREALGTKNSGKNKTKTSVIKSKTLVQEEPVNETPTRGNRQRTRSSARLRTAKLSTPPVPQEVQPSMPDVVPSMPDVEPSTSDVEPSTSDVEPSTSDVEPSSSEIHVESNTSNIEPVVEPDSEVKADPHPATPETDMEMELAEPQVTTTPTTPKSAACGKKSVRRSLVKCITSPDSSVGDEALPEPVTVDKVFHSDESSDSERKEQDEVVSSTSQETLMSPSPIARRTRKSMSSLDFQSPLPSTSKQTGQCSTAPRRKSMAKGFKVKSPEEWVKLLAKSPMVEMSRRTPKLKTPPEKPVLSMAINFENMDFMPSLDNPQETEFIASDSFIELTSTNKKTEEKENDVVESTEMEMETSEVEEKTEPEVVHQPPQTVSLEETIHNVLYFRDLVVSGKKRLIELCKTWQAINEFGFDLSEEVKGEIRTTIGQAQLLMDQRFKQFTGLVDDCEFKRGEKVTTCTDLQGFWDMIFFQVEDVDKKFEDLKKRKEANWVVEETTTIKTNTKTKA